MFAVWKFPLTLTERQQIAIPQGAEILSVQSQDGQLCLWAKVQPSVSNAQRRINIVGTGWCVKPEALGTFIDTVQMDGLVWHVFDGFEQK